MINKKENSEVRMQDSKVINIYIKYDLYEKIMEAYKSEKTKLNYELSFSAFMRKCILGYLEIT